MEDYIEIVYQNCDGYYNVDIYTYNIKEFETIMYRKRFYTREDIVEFLRNNDIKEIHYYIEYIDRSVDWVNYYVDYDDDDFNNTYKDFIESDIETEKKKLGV